MPLVFDGHPLTRIAWGNRSLHINFLRTINAQAPVERILTDTSNKNSPFHSIHQAGTQNGIRLLMPLVFDGHPVARIAWGKKACTPTRRTGLRFRFAKNNNVAYNYGN